jgi:hypothetical protein
MPKTIAREDHHVLVTIGYLEKYPNIGVLDMMKLGDLQRKSAMIARNELGSTANGMGRRQAP